MDNVKSLTQITYMILQAIMQQALIKHSYIPLNIYLKCFGFIMDVSSKSYKHKNNHIGINWQDQERHMKLVHEMAGECKKAHIH